MFSADDYDVCLILIHHKGVTFHILNEMV